MEIGATDRSCGIELIDRARDAARAERTALIDRDGVHTYRELTDAAETVALGLIDAGGGSDLAGRRVAYLIPPSFAYVAVQWGVWRSGGIAVPLCLSHPRPELEHVITDCGAEILVAHPQYAAGLTDIAADHGLTFVSTKELFASTAHGALPLVDGERGALMLYTSGTTGKPKGALLTHRNLAAQVGSLIQAWEWHENDHILHVLPLHHIHGVVNILTCALWAGARCSFLPRFDVDQVWKTLIDRDITLFMAVPTIYAKLIEAYNQAEPDRRRAMEAACRRLRLMVSGSAALPVGTLETWRKISGHTLLERYGMTEIGMAISNPLRGERRPGSVGTPLPGVRVMLADERGQPVEPGAPGEIYVKGEGAFKGYWNRPRETQAAFRDGWFRTGDIAVLENGYYRILGRESVDIIKTGGYKVSALEIEEVLRTHPKIKACAVVGVSDPEWGERVSAAVVLHPDEALSLDELRAWGKERLAVYKVPTRLAVVLDLPRNAMGKVTKKQVAELFATNLSMDTEH